MRLLPDTNLLIYEMVEDSLYHKEAVEIYERASEILIPSIVLHEFLWVTLKKLEIRKEVIVAKLEEYREDERVKFVEPPFEAYSQAVKALENPSEINDLIILFTAKILKCVLGTFDERLKKKAKRFGIEVLP